MRIKVKGATAQEFVKRTFFLLYEACGGTSGYGFMKRKDGAAEDDVWKNVTELGDYGKVTQKMEKTSGRAYGDYVFGRMMKFSCSWQDDVVDIPDRTYSPDYQSFCHVYKDGFAIAKAVAESLGCDIKILDTVQTPG